jgi:hypothetical protein
MKKELIISKLDAARRQLETAIRIYFHNGDPVSIHTLTAAGYNVVRDINDKRGGDPMLAKQQIMDRVKPEYQKMFRDKINEAENFFKHADNDPSASLKFDPRQTEILIVDACSQYYKLTGEDLPLSVIFRAWYIANNPELFLLDEEIAGTVSIASPAVLKMGRLGYFNYLLPSVMHAHK